MKRHGISLKAKFFLTSLISGLVIVAVTVAVSATLSIQASIDQAQASLDTVSQTDVKLLSVYLQQKANQIQLVAGTRLARDFVSAPTLQNKEALRGYFQSRIQSSDELYDLSILDLNNGTTLVDGKGTDTLGTNVSATAFWSHRSDPNAFIDPAVVRLPDKTLLFFVSVPVQNSVGTPAGLLVLSVDWGKFSRKEFAHAKVGETGYTVVFGPKGVSVYHPDDSRILSEGSVIDAARVAYEKKNLFQRYEFNGEMKYMYAHEVPETGWVVAPNVKESELIAPTVNSVFYSLLIGLVLLAATGLVSYLIARGVSRPVMNFVTELSEASNQIGLSSGQLSQASQEIANGATEQASQIEETSASMEELASMVKQNVESAKQASLLAGRSSDSSRQGSEEMTKMAAAMEEIGRSADEIRGVIDVIEDISFQTNMLALNAAVEAARAGEAGLGFAVVADEVKNLANRSSASAKETAKMIKEANRKIAAGIETSQKLSGIFQGIIGDSLKVGEVTLEVEAASRQQDEGISQVNQAITQFDSVVQNNASSSEETASAAEELQGQVQTLETVVRRLYSLVTGKEYSGTVVRPVFRKSEETVPVAAVSRQKISFETDEELLRS